MTPTTTALSIELAPDISLGPTRRGARLAAALGALGGTVLFLDLSLHAFAPLDRTYFVVATLMALCLLGVPTAYWLEGVITGGWRRRVAAAGTAMVTAGVATWVVAFALLFADPEDAFSQRLTPSGSLLMAVGMIVLGTTLLAPLTSHAGRGWRRSS